MKGSFKYDFGRWSCPKDFVYNVVRVLNRPDYKNNNSVMVICLEGKLKLIGYFTFDAEARVRTASDLDAIRNFFFFQRNVKFL